MTMKERIVEALVLDGKAKTPAQLAAQFRTSENSIRARINEIRDDGYAIYANKRTDTKGRTKTFYRHGTPNRAIVQAGRLAQKMGLADF